MGVEIFINLSEYTEILSDTAAGLIASDVRKFAKNYVAKDTKALMTSIELDRVGDTFYIWTDLPYSLAQEFGRPDLRRYTFTPYMRPAAKQATSESNVLKRIKNAESVAMRGAKK